MSYSSLRLLATLLWALSVGSAAGAGRQLTGQHAPATTPALKPADAQKAFVLPDGFEARLFASEPDVVNPVAMTWDERGRLWIIELYEYPMGAPDGAKPRDRIKILEDADNDGRADKVTVFAEGLNLATGLLLGNGGVYVGQAPHFLFLQDTNRDDVADTRTTLLTGFGLDDRHELLNGFMWGPDGWLYMTHGVFTHSTVKIPEASEPGVEVTAAIARFHPRTKKFEVFAEGTSNPWGLDFDRYGNAYVSACVIDHLFHMAPGGIYVRQGGTPPNPYAYELLPSIVDHKHHMAAYSGVCIYQGNQFPEAYRGHVFMGNIHQNAINHDRLTADGSSFKATAEKDFLTTKDGWFMPVNQQIGPDGALWVADWYDKYPCYQNAMADPEGVDREHGRIWRIVYARDKGSKGSRPDRGMNLASLSNIELIKLLEHPNIWQRRMAQRLLAEGANRRIAGQDLGGQPTIAGIPERDELQQLVLGKKRLETRLAALWTFYTCGPMAPWAGLLEKLMDDPEPTVRAWAIRLSVDDLKARVRSIAEYRKRNLDEKATQLEYLFQQQLERLQTAARDPDPIVRFAVATTCRMLASSSLTVDTPPEAEVPIEPILAALIESSSDAKDPLLPFQIWMAGEPGFARNPELSLSWFADTGASLMPLSGVLIRKGMRRICDTQDAAKMDLAAEFLGTVVDRSPRLALAAIEGLIEGQSAKPFRPRMDTKLLFESLAKNANPQLKERAQLLGALWGNATALEATLRAINDASLPEAERTKAINAAKQLKNDAARDALLQVVTSKNGEPIVTAAIRALGEVGGDGVVEVLLRSWPSFPAGVRASAAEVLVSRRPWATNLLSAIQAKTVSASDLPLTVLRSLSESKDSKIRQRAAEVIGRVRPANADKQKLIEQKRAMIAAGGPVDLEAGRELARKTCFVCHKLYAEGAEVGPDLTGVGRSSLEALLANVIDPNQVVGKGYENVEIETKDGRSVSGRMIENTETRIKLLASGPKEEIVARSDVENMRVSELSVMPEGLEQMPDQDFRNLILYILKPPQEQGSK